MSDWSSDQKLDQSRPEAVESTGQSDAISAALAAHFLALLHPNVKTLPPIIRR